MKKVAIAFALILASLALVACGDSSDDTTPTTSETTTESSTETGGNAGEAKGKSASTASSVEFEADPGGQLAYTSDSATAKAGKVTVDFTNPQPLPHDVAIEDSSGGTVGKTEVISEDSSSTTVDLKPGEYTFYCTVPGHREAGMEGTLAVR